MLPIHRTPGPGDLWIPPEFDDSEYLTPEQAAEEARDDVLATPSAIAEFVWEIGTGQHEPVKAHELDDIALLDAPPHVLLAVVLTGGNDQANMARCLLRDRMLAYDGTQHCIEERASELLKEFGEPEAYDWRQEQ